MGKLLLDLKGTNFNSNNNFKSKFIWKVLLLQKAVRNTHDNYTVA